MNENKIMYYTRVILRTGIACVSLIWLTWILWQVQDLTILVKSILLIGLFCAMFLNIYNGRENRYNDFKQSVAQLSKLDESGFTYYIERLYRTLGYYTKIPFQNQARKQLHEIILRKDQECIIMHCYNCEAISLVAVQQLVGRIGLCQNRVRGQLLITGTADKKTYQLAKLNDIEIIDGEQLASYMLEAAEKLEGYLDGAISAFWCHPFKWFRKHFLEAEPRFMNDKTWLEWVTLEFRNRGYQINDTESPKEYGVQFVAQQCGEILAIKCVGTNHKVTSADLNALKASIPFYEVTRAMLITNSHVAYNEKMLARRLEIELLNFDEFLKWLKLQEEKTENDCEEGEKWL